MFPGMRFLFFAAGISLAQVRFVSIKPAVH